MINQNRAIADEELNQELLKIPDLNSYRENLSLLHKIDKASLSLPEIHKLFFKYASLLPQAVGYTTSETINLLKLSRVRLNIDTIKEDKQLIRTFSYPPSNICGQNGRANIKFKSVFYCADTAESALAEARPKVNDIAYLSKWSIQSDRDCRYSPFLSPSLPNLNPWMQSASEIYKVVVESSKKLGKDKSAQLELLFNFVAELFIKEQSPYSLTSWLSFISMYEDYGTDFIVYPSYTLNSIACNFAFHPNYVDNYFKLNKVYKLWIQKVDSDGASFLPLEVGKLFLTNIKWEKPTEEDMLFFKRDGNKITKKLIGEKNTMTTV